jgi:hypothetical protein
MLVLKDAFFNIDGEFTFEIVNIGGVSATIFDGWVALGVVDDERWFKIPNHGEDVLERLSGRIFNAGEFKSITIKNTSEIAVKLMAPNAFRDSDVDRYFFYGAFTYVDERGEEFGTMRLAVIRRKWNSVLEKFQRTGNNDHEYSD